MQDINTYILLPKEARKAHINLSEPCIERGGPIGRLSTYCKGLLAHVLDTTIPMGRNGIYCCHACNNGMCCNPNHLYWGTHTENVQDSITAGTHVSLICNRINGKFVKNIAD